MPGLSGIEVLNRARAEPQVQDATFALTTEFSGGKAGQKKTLSHFQVNDDRGRPVNVLIKPLHASLVAELVKVSNYNSSSRGFLKIVCFVVFFQRVSFHRPQLISDANSNARLQK